MSPATSSGGGMNRWVVQPYGSRNPRQPTPVSSQQLCNGAPAAASGEASAGGSRVVSFQVQADTRWGDTVALVGSTEQLGAWAPDRGLALCTDAASYPVWRLPTAQLLAVGAVYEFKFVILRAAHDGQPASVECEAVLTRTSRGPPYCTYGLRGPASCVLYVPAAQSSCCPTVRTPYVYQPRACRTYRVPCGAPQATFTSS